jgi:glucose/mannose-6-phosphate isomerase
VSEALEPPFEPRDPNGMGALIASAPEQIEAQRARLATASGAVTARGIERIAVGGMGGSAIAADLVAAQYADRLPHPLVAVRDYTWPAWVTGHTLAVLASYSGNTEETLSLYREARARSVPAIAIPTGGALADACAADRVPWLPLPTGMPPRAALYAAWVTLAFVLGELEWVDDVEASWRDAVAALRAGVAAWGATVPEASNPAKQMARGLHRRLIYVYAPDRLGALATRLRNQINENAKLLGHSAVVPELNHNEVVGWERPGAAGRDAAAIVLRDGTESAEIDLRLTLTSEYLERRGVRVLETPVLAGGRLARMASLAGFGDYLSYYLAMLNGVDPTPIESLDEFKRRLSEGRAPRAPR